MKTYRIILGFCGLFIASPLSAIAQPTGSTAGMSDAERAFVEKQNARKEELRKRYFSPEAKAKLQEELANRNSNGTSSPSAQSASIAKAKSAGVDTRVFGVPLGEPINLPRCATANEQKRELQSYDPYSGLPRPSKNFDPLSAFRGVQTSVTCQSDGAVMAFLGALTGGKPADRYIMLAKGSCPEWAYCEVAASLHQGNLAGVVVFIQPGASGDYMEKQLRAKYGKPTNREPVSYQNQYGATYRVESLEWNLPGLHVALAPGASGGGLLVVETEAGRRIREAQGAAEETKKPKL